MSCMSQWRSLTEINMDVWFDGSLRFHSCCNNPRGQSKTKASTCLRRVLTHCGFSVQLTWIGTNKSKNESAKKSEAEQTDTTANN